MANAEKLIPFLIRWESGTANKTGETNESLFERARKRGTTNDPLDRGGFTVVGLTLAAYKSYCKKHNISTPTSDNLKHIPYSMWLAVFKEDYWDKYRGDQITSQSVANILVDYLWGSGLYAVTKVQKALGLKADGIVGNVTISAINKMKAYDMFILVKQIRINHYNAIVKANSSQKKWLKGWLNRVNDMKFEG